MNNHKRPSSLKNIDVSKTVVSNKASFNKKVFKYFISHKDAKKIRRLYILVLVMTAYRRDFGKTKYMSFW